MHELLIDLQDVSFAYDKHNLVLEDVSLQVHQGDFLGIVGPNGGGKSTLLKLILGLLPCQKGKILVFGLPPKESRTKIGYVPQFKTFSRIFPISVEETILMGRLGRTRFFGNYTKKDREIVDEILEKLKIAHLKKRTIAALSGGEMQRVMIARALAIDPALLFLDEPTSSTDPMAEENLFDLLKEMNQKITILIVSHDIGFISHYINKVACINQTLVCHQTAPLTPEMIEELYQSPIRMIHHHNTEKP